ncbi:MAG TPA: universal stress protein [Methylomirabilota bacterium]|nr:universal stress protein [Methylomirabilota bacterium]
MYKKILVPLDGSSIAEAVLPYARAFARALRIPVHLLQVLDSETLIPSVEAQQDRSHNVLTAGREHNGDYLKEIAASFFDPAAVSCSVRIGKPAEVIIEVAATNLDTLIAMATHGRSGITRWLLGSVAEKVLHGAENDVLLIRGIEPSERKEAAAHLKQLVVPLDGSETAEQALPCASELTKKMNLELILLRVYLMPGVAYPTGSYAPDWKLLDQETRERASEYLQGKINQLRNEGLERVCFRVLEGSAAEKIIEVARENPGSLIAMSTHGASGVGRWVLGSITERVIRHSDSAVLVIRAKSAASEK